VIKNNGRIGALPPEKALLARFPLRPVTAQRDGCRP